MAHRLLAPAIRSGLALLVVLAPIGLNSPHAGRASGSVTSGLLAWHPHLVTHLAVGLQGVVDLSDGHLDLIVSDLDHPARGIGLSLTHIWDSTQAQAGHSTWAGQGWQTTLTQSMSGAPGSAVTYTDDTGAAWIFPFSAGAYQSPGGFPWALTASGSGYTLTNTLSGAIRSFDSSGRYLSTADTYGNANTLTYGASGPTSDANSGGRALTLAYSSGLLSDVQSPLWVSSVGAKGQHITYGYGGSSACASTQLCSVTRGAGTSDAATTQFSYSGNLLTGVTTGAGHAWSFSYTAGQLTGVTSPSAGTLGQQGYTPSYTTQITYAVGQTTVVRGSGTSAALTTTYTLDASGQPSVITDGLGHTAKATFDADHDFLTTTDGNNQQTTYHYQYVGSANSVGLLTEVDRPAINILYPSHAATAPVLTNSYDAATHDLLEADTNQGSSVRFTYDGHHQVVTRAELVSSTGGTYAWRGASYSYDAFGELTDSVDGRGVSVPNTTSFATNPTVTVVANNRFTTHRDYSAQGDLKDVASPPVAITGGHGAAPLTTNYSYDGDGDTTSLTTAAGNTTSFGFDHLGRQVSTTLPRITLYTGSAATPTSSTVYDGDGQIIQETDGNGDVKKAGFDPLGRVISATNALNEITSYTYTATNPATMQDPRGNVSTYTYDASGRLATATNAAGGVTSYQYDNANNPTVITQGDGTTAVTTDTQAYNADNQLSSKTITGPNTTAQTTTYSYDLNGSLVRTAMANGTVQFTDYDLVDQSLSIELDAGSVNTPAGTNQQRYTYDAAGNRLTVTDADARLSIISYDGLDRVTRVQEGNANVLTVGYDAESHAVNRQDSRQNPTLTGFMGTTYAATYNAAGWLTTATDTLGATGTVPGFNLTTTYGYDGAGRGRTRTYPGGTISATLNAGGEATSIGDGTVSATFGYNADDQVTSVSGAGPTESRTYDAAGRLSHLGAIGLSNIDLAYNGASWTTAITSTVNGGAQQITNFTHDALARLVGQSGSGSGTWSYDGSGNYRTAHGAGGQLTFTYNTASPNEVAVVNGAYQSQFQYDNHGDVTSDGGITGVNLTYDTRARLSTVTAAQGGAVRATMGYNAAGRRVFYTYTPSGQSQPTTIIQFVYSGAKISQAITTAGGQSYTDSYVYRQDGTPLELIRTQGSSTSRYWYVLSAKGDVIAVTDQNGAPVDQYNYDAAGNLTGINETVPQRLRYRGYWYDAELGWYWLSTREYEPRMERFLQPDPAGVGGQYQYIYADDNLVDNSDPSGLSAMTNRPLFDCGDSGCGDQQPVANLPPDGPSVAISPDITQAVDAALSGGGTAVINPDGSAYVIPASSRAVAAGEGGEESHIESTSGGGGLADITDGSTLSSDIWDSEGGAYVLITPPAEATALGLDNVVAIDSTGGLEHAFDNHLGATPQQAAMGDIPFKGDPFGSQNPTSTKAEIGDTLWDTVTNQTPIGTYDGPDGNGWVYQPTSTADRYLVVAIDNSTGLVVNAWAWGNLNNPNFRSF